MAKSPGPPYQRIAVRMRRDLETGRLTGRLPSEPLLAKRFDISRMTLRRAIGVLVDEGYLEVRHGAGTFVTDRVGEAPARTVGLVSPLITNSAEDPFLRHLAFALLAAAANRGWTLRLAPDLAALRRRRGDELAACIAAVYFAGQSDQLADPPAPLVLMDSDPLPGVPTILPDNQTGITAAMDRLFALGHRDIVHLAGSDLLVSGRERKAAFIGHHSALGLDGREDLVFAGTFGWEDGQKAMAAWWRRKRRPTAVVCANDHMALGCITWLAEHGLRAGQDVSVVGFDGLDLAYASWPPLATCAVDFRSHADLVLDAVDKRQPGVRRSAVTLIERMSMGKAQRP